MQETHPLKLPSPLMALVEKKKQVVHEGDQDDSGFFFEFAPVDKYSNSYGNL